MQAITNGCEVRSQPPFQIVAVRGEVDLSWSSEIRTAILGALEAHNNVLVELGEVSYIDSSGIAALVEGYQKARSSDIRFALVNISSPVQSVLELARLDQVFPIFASVEAASG